MPRVSGQDIRLKDIKKDFKDIDLKPLIEKTNYLSKAKKEKLNYLICYLNVALRSRYSGLGDDKHIKYFDAKNKFGNFKITQDGVGKVMHSIFNINDNHNEDLQNENELFLREIVYHRNIITNDDNNVLLSMCTHTNTCFDSVDSFTETATQFSRKTNLALDKKTLKYIKNYLENNLKIRLPNEILHILITCADND